MRTFRFISGLFSLILFVLCVFNLVLQIKVGNETGIELMIACAIVNAIIAYFMFWAIRNEQ